jgi:hypothetical protein
VQIYSTGDVAKIFDTDVWRIRRLYEDGMLQEPSRLAGKRAIPSESIPSIVDALREKHWLAPPKKQGRRQDA